MEEYDANLTEIKESSGRKPAIDTDCVSRNLRRREARTILDQVSTRSKPIKKLQRTLKKEQRRFSNEYARSESG